MNYRNKARILSSSGSTLIPEDAATPLLAAQTGTGTSGVVHVSAQSSVAIQATGGALGVTETITIQQVDSSGNAYDAKAASATRQVTANDTVMLITGPLRFKCVKSATVAARGIEILA